MRNNKIKIIFILLLLVFFIAGCSRPFCVEVLPEFAISAKGKNFSIYSPDGFKMRIKTERNNPQKDTLFWSEALKTQLKNDGYFLFDEVPFNSINLEWRKITWLMPVGQGYYKYMTAIAVKGRRIYIIEASGEKELFDSYKEDIEKIIFSVFAKK